MEEKGPIGRTSNTLEVQWVSRTRLVPGVSALSVDGLIRSLRARTIARVVSRTGTAWFDEKLDSHVNRCCLDRKEAAVHRFQRPLPRDVRQFLGSSLIIRSVLRGIMDLRVWRRCGDWTLCSIRGNVPCRRRIPQICWTAHRASHMIELHCQNALMWRPCKSISCGRAAGVL
jgi:hypothetical protein